VWEVRPSILEKGRNIVGKAKSRPCQHPRKAVASVAATESSTVYTCKKCSKTWTEGEPTLIEEPDGSPLGTRYPLGPDLVITQIPSEEL
jgi:hypothetical protein